MSATAVAVPTFARTTRVRPRSRRLAAGTSLGLLAVAVVHLLDGAASLSDVFYIGALELALSAACVPLAVMLVMRPTRGLWLSVGGLLWTALGFYVASRTIGLPGSADDIGNWGEPLGLANLASELPALGAALLALGAR